MLLEWKLFETTYDILDETIKLEWKALKLTLSGVLLGPVLDELPTLEN